LPSAQGQPRQHIINQVRAGNKETILSLDVPQARVSVHHNKQGANPGLDDLIADIGDICRTTIKNPEFFLGLICAEFLPGRKSRN